MIDIDNLPKKALFNEKEVAALIGMSYQTLRRWRMDGIGPKYIKMSRAVRYSGEALIDWMATSTRTGV